MTRLAIFDLDNTLLGGDSDHAWGEYLIHAGLVDADEHRRRNDGFYAQYKQGVLDMNNIWSLLLRRSWALAKSVFRCFTPSL
jgi:phosphoserine phosphatase